MLAAMTFVRPPPREVSAIAAICPPASASVGPQSGATVPAWRRDCKAHRCWRLRATPRRTLMAVGLTLTVALAECRLRFPTAWRRLALPNLVRRRDLFRLGAAAGLAAIAAPAWAQSLDIWEPRRAILDNLHTGETFNEVYFANGSYLPDALAEATRVMRDWRTGDEHYIDP